MQRDVIPLLMREAPRWLVWRHEQRRGGKPTKIPYYVNGKQRGKGITLDGEQDLAQLATFPEAQRAFDAGDYSGLGFALGPDGTRNYWQGIDLDGINENGLEDLAQALPGYVETSPSGKGAHAIGYGQPFKALGSNGTGIEAYSSKRFFTVTGTNPHGDLECLAEYVKKDLLPLYTLAFHRVIDSQELQDSQESQDLQSYRQGEEGEKEIDKDHDIKQNLSDLPPNCRPQKIGHRNRVLFDLARHLKTKYPDSKSSDHRSLLEGWLQEHRPVIGTKDWATTWADFRNAWRKVKYLEGQGPLTQIFESIDMTKPIPQQLLQLGYDETIYKVVELCRLLSLNSPEGILFLGNRTLAGLIGVSQPSAGDILRMLIEDGILELIEKGHLRKGHAPRASTYRYLGVPGGMAVTRLCCGVITRKAGLGHWQT